MIILILGVGMFVVWFAAGYFHLWISQQTGCSIPEDCHFCCTEVCQSRARPPIHDPIQVEDPKKA